MALGDGAEVRASEHERAEHRLGILWIRVCRVLEGFVEDFDWQSWIVIGASWMWRLGGMYKATTSAAPIDRRHGRFETDALATNCVPNRGKHRLSSCQKYIEP